MKTNIHFWSHLAQFFSEREMFQTKVVEKIKTNILCSVTFFFRKSYRLWENAEKYGTAGQASDSNTDMRRLTTRTRSEKCVVRRFHLCANVVECRLRLKRDGTRAETRLCLSAKRTSPFKPAGASVQSTAGSRGARISGSNAGYTMFRGSVKGTGYPLHSPVSP